MDKYVNANRAHWDDMVEAHVKSDFYDVEGFKKGRNTLDKITLEGVGDVKGKTLLHLQCHFGLDTLSFARLGAKVTGIDFSPKAIKHARAIAKELGIPANFVCSDVYDLPNRLFAEEGEEGEVRSGGAPGEGGEEGYDIVFTSQGVLPWLPDLGRWAEVIVRFIKPSGFFFIQESHPMAHVFDDDNPQDLRIRYPYFLKEAMRFEGEYSYAASHIETANPVSYEWMHPVSDILNSLISQGLTVERLNEYPYSFHKHYPFLEKGDDGYWRLPNGRVDVPLMFTLRARK